MSCTQSGFLEYSGKTSATESTDDDSRQSNQCPSNARQAPTLLKIYMKSIQKYTVSIHVTRLHVASGSLWLGNRQGNLVRHPLSSHVFMTTPSHHSIRRARPQKDSIMSLNERSMDSHTEYGHETKRKVAAAAERNQGAILDVLQSQLERFECLQEPIMLLEVASGTGQHAAAFGKALSGKNVVIQPSDMVTEDFPSITAWSSSLKNVLEPIQIDCRHPFDDWNIKENTFHVVLCINMTHISPIQATHGLCTGAARALVPGGVLCIYGPFLVHGAPTTPSNQAFDASLKSRDPAWGLRDIDDDIDAWCVPEGLQRHSVLDMPANNLMLVYVKELGHSPSSQSSS